MSSSPRSAHGKIRVLGEHLANKIAAGEVVERPASVVKELIENSIDAGAGRIEVRLEAGGRDLIEVVDDGLGMSFDDTVRCLERHATSKLTDSSDLFAIETLGFRGEALPSIAAVARVDIVTRERDAVSGTRVSCEAGTLIEHVEAGAPAGTRIKVEDLFANVPARRKFLRRPETELGNVSEVVTRTALAHPSVGFRLINGGRTIFDSPAGGSLTERVVAALGKAVRCHLQPVAGGMDEVRVTGLLASPEVTKSNNRSIYLFVNRRFVKDRYLNHAVFRAYGESVDRGRFPVAVLFLEVPSGQVDVNVHPQKIEVRFANARGVYQALQGAVSQTLRASPSSAEAVRSYSLRAEPAPTRGSASEPVGYEAHKARVLSALERSRPRARGAPIRGGVAREPPAPETANPHSLREEALGPFADLRVIGQLHAAYLVCESEEGLVLLDQHAAHERLVFERLLKAREARSVPTQRLLVPRTLSLPAGDAEKLEEHRESLAEVGFDISSMGGGDVAVRSVPAELADRDVQDVLSNLLDELTSFGEGASLERAIEGMLATVACHSVVRSGQTLSREAGQGLLRQLEEARVAPCCPHGRPLLFTMSFAEIERRLGRR